MTSASTTSSEAPPAPDRILVRAPSWVGDVMMATPALRALRSAHPGAEILLSGRPHLAPLVEGLPTVDRYLPEPPRGLRPLLASARELRRERCDWAVLLPDSARAALPAFLARIPVRCGYAREPLRRMLCTHTLDVPREAGARVPISMVERYLRITRRLGCPDAGDGLDLVVSEAARTATAARLGAEGLDGAARLVVVTPGASFGASKLWPAEHFAEACDRLRDEQALHTVLAPGPGEEAVADEIAGRMKTPATNLKDPPLRLDELGALLERAELLVSNDTGPRHMAVALGIPVIALLGPTDRRHTDHLLERQRVLREDVDCSPCHLKTCPIDHRCMTRLLPERVVHAAAELLS